MVFSSIPFLYFFIPLSLTAYRVTPARYRNATLLMVSVLFYFSGEPAYTALLLLSSLSDYLHSLYIEKHRGRRRSRYALISSIVINIGMLGFFKYADFLIDIINTISGAGIKYLELPLPVGISFFTFQTMSYTIDVYRGEVKAQRNLVSFAAFVSLFPQLVAGPIVRYADIEGQLESRRMSVSEAASGIHRFIVGLGKKVLIANVMGELCNSFYQTPERSVLYCWVYAAAFTLQIYYDFSGYSDMAVGLGRILGFKFPENFDYPYISQSLSEFWRRWHMTLGGWFRDYVYIPMGGNRVSKIKWLRNIFAVWLLTGLWHGADWNFILWGILFGVLLTIEKLWLGGVLKKAGRIPRHIYVMTIVMISMVLFNADRMSGAAMDIGGMFGAGGLRLCTDETLYRLRNYAIPLILGIVGATPAVKRLAGRIPAAAAAIMEPAATGALLIAATAYLIDGSFNPFLYFRF